VHNKSTENTASIPEELGIWSARLGGALGPTGLAQLAHHNPLSVRQPVHRRGPVVPVVVVVFTLRLPLAPARIIKR